MIHYIALWGENELGRQLSYSPAGLKKAKYVVNVLSRIEDTKIVSFASGGQEWNGFYKGINTKWNDKMKIGYCFTFGSSNKYLRMIERMFNILQLFSYLIKVPNDDIVVIYHERYFRHAIRLLRLFKSAPKIILQVEEIYTLAGKYPKCMVDTEIKSIKRADAYILVNDIISSVIKLPCSVPSCVSYGPYLINEIDCDSNSQYDKIHVVYAGIIDRIKKGAEMAVRACQFLPKNYCVHIAGFGEKSDVDYIIGLIGEIRSTSKCDIIFEGCLNGKDYDNLIAKCGIGLSTQVTGKLNYSDTSFPSKVINYLSYGLTVVSTKIKVLELSKVSDLLSFYIEDNPKAIANAILNCPMVGKQKAIQRIEKLNNTFENELKEVILCLRS